MTKKYEINCEDVNSGVRYGGIYIGELAECMAKIVADFPFYSPKDSKATSIYQFNSNGDKVQIV